jgi:hypothetical protein
VGADREDFEAFRSLKVKTKLMVVRALDRRES